MLESKIHNIAIEQAVLTALMTVADSLETVINDIDVECFYPERHKQIFRAIVELHNENQPYDVVMVEQRLKQQNILHLMGGTEYLKTMMGEAPSSFFNLESYAATLIKFKAHRELEALGQKFTQLAQDMSQPDVFTEAENLFGQNDLTEQAYQGASLKDALQSSVQQMIEKSEARHNKQFVGVRFNLEHLDNKLGVIQRGHFCVVGGRPGSGKSTLAQMLAIDTALVFNQAVLFVSAEMDKETLANRLISALSSIPYNNIHNADLYDGMLQQYTNARTAYENLPIWIEPKQKPSISEVRSYARKAKRKYKTLGCIIVDYLQLLRDPSKKDRFQEVSSISRELKSMAKEFNCPVIALVQLNRDSEKNQRPKSSDIKESGQIEQDADQIIMVNPLTNKDDQQPLGVTELIITKNRHGKRGIVRVRDHLDVCRFKAIEEQTDFDSEHQF